MSHVNKSDVVNTFEVGHKFVYSVVAMQSINVNVFYMRLEYPTPYILKTILKACNGSTGFNKIDSLSFYTACQYGKNHMLHFNSIETKTTTPLQLIYADLCGPSHISSTKGYNYYLSILDDFSRFT